MTAAKEDVMGNYYDDGVNEILAQEEAERQRIVQAAGGEVARQDACPACGQNLRDMLAWQDDETVICASCGQRYDPLA